MQNAYTYLIQGKNIIIVINNKSYTISKDTHVSYNKIVEAINNNDWESVTTYVEPVKTIIKYGNGNISIDGNTILWKGQPFHNALSSKMIQMIRESLPVEPLVKFMENLMENPSARAVSELYGFLEKGNLPITTDGHFLAFKKVNGAYYDVYTQTVPNKLGHMFTEDEVNRMPLTVGKQQNVTVELVNGNTVISMPRNMVDDDRDRTCSTGLHFCSKQYLSCYSGSRVLALKINPRDVVSIPSDYNDSKGRCCKYIIVDDVTDDIENAFASVVSRKYEQKTDNSIGGQPDEFDDLVNNIDDSVLDTKQIELSLDDTDTGEILYNLVKKSDPTVVVYSDLTYAQAEAMKNKHIRQKKAVLISVISS